MNILVIVLGIILVLLAYYIYTILTAVPTIIKDVDLTQSAPTIPPSSISNPYSVNYSVGVWIYINQFTPQIERFLSYGDTTFNGAKSIFSLRLDRQRGNLYADILVNKIGLVGSSALEPIILPVQVNIEAFPIQKWVYVVVSASYNYIETYINGKFTTAVNINNNTNLGINGIYQAQAPRDPASSATFTFGGAGSRMDDGTVRSEGCPVTLAKLSRWDTPLSAGDVYNNYMKGNGHKSSAFGPSYHLDINLQQDKSNYVLSVF
jgi:hypothetical protein